MKLHTLRIENYRSFHDETIEFGPYTCFVGPNGAGKSTVLNALNVLFREVTSKAADHQTLAAEDFCEGNTSCPVRITATFDRLTHEAELDLKDYVRHGKLIVVAEAHWDSSQGRAEVKQHGMRLAMLDFARFFEAEGSGQRITELKTIYEQVRQQHSQLPPPGTKQAMIEALRAYEAKRPDLCTPIPSADQFYGWSRGINRLEKYIQWVFVPAVKNAGEEGSESKNSCLGKLLDRTVRNAMSFQSPIEQMRQSIITQLRELMDSKVGALRSLSETIQTSLRRYSDSQVELSLEWALAADGAVSVDEPFATVRVNDGDFKNSISRMGHGLQRAYLLAILEQLARTTVGGTRPTLLFGCEEPELYQHPPMARRLARTVSEMARQADAQVIICTHSPYFVSAHEFEQIRMVSPRCDAPSGRIRRATFEDVSGRYCRAYPGRTLNRGGALHRLSRLMQPSLNELFFCNSIVLVEGIEDQAYLQTWFELKNLQGEIGDTGCHIVACSLKSSMVEPIAIARALEIPVFVMFDRDVESKTQERQKHECDNAAILSAIDSSENQLADAPLCIMPYSAAWRTCIAEELRREVGNEIWDAAKNRVLADSEVNGKDLGKCPIMITQLLTELFNNAYQLRLLTRVCNEILRFAKDNASRRRPA
jgi:putative ATP-dependent endonuclease of the OLD family